MVYVVLGIFLILFFFIEQKFNEIIYHIIYNYLYPLFLVPLFGIEVKGSKRWLDLGSLPRFQPIEILKPFFVIVVSLILSLEKKNLYFKYSLSAIVLLPTIILLLSQPDLGQTLLIISVWLAIIFVSGINLFLFIFFLLTTCSITSFLIFMVPKFEYIKIRLIAFLNTSDGNNYQADKASDAISSGGFWKRNR